MMDMKKWSVSSEKEGGQLGQDYKKGKLPGGEKEGFIPPRGESKERHGESNGQ